MRTDTSSQMPFAQPEARNNSTEAHMPFALQVTTLTWRYLLTVFRTPAAVIPGLLISVFFLLVYQSTLGGASNFLPGLAGKSYLGFILPLSVVSAALSGAGGAGQAIVRDIASGYFDKLMLTPISRVALLLGSILTGAVILGLQAALVTGVGILMGLRPETGFPGVLAIIGIALLLGTGFASFTVASWAAQRQPCCDSGGELPVLPALLPDRNFCPVSAPERLDQDGCPDQPDHLHSGSHACHPERRLAGRCHPARCAGVRRPGHRDFRLCDDEPARTHSPEITT